MTTTQWSTTQCHYLNYNPNYKAYDDDCTNFVSQSLAYGVGARLTMPHGIRMTTTGITTRGWDQIVTYAPSFYNFAIYGSGRTYELSYLNDLGPADVVQTDWQHASQGIYPDGVLDHTMMVTSWAAWRSRRLQRYSPHIPHDRYAE